MLVSLVLAPAAQAGTVRVTSDCDKIGCTWDAEYSAAPGERNDVTMSRPSGYEVVEIRDDGAFVIAGSGCTALDPHAARCAVAGVESLGAWLLLRDGDDTAVIDSGNATGGAGDDRLSTNGGFLAGGPGSDELTATETTGVTFVDGDGAEPARDRYVGNSGGDSVDYRGRPQRIRADLRKGVAGAAGEGDVLIDIDNVAGGSGDDVLVGTSRANVLSGADGNDRLFGLGGDDTLAAGRGGDLADGGPGRDRVQLDNESTRALADRIRCGSGKDRIDGIGVRDRLDDDCERLAFGHALISDLLLRSPLTSPGGWFLRTWWCDCRGARLVVRAAGRTVALARGRGEGVSLRLNDDGRRLLAARGRLAIVFRVRGPNDRGGFRTVIRSGREGAAAAPPSRPRAFDVDPVVLAVFEQDELTLG